MKNEHSKHPKRICDGCWQKKIESGEDVVVPADAAVVKKKNIFEKAGAVKNWGARMATKLDHGFKAIISKKSGADLLKARSQLPLGELLLRALCIKPERMVAFLVKHPNETMTLLDNHPSDSVPVICLNHKEVVRVLRKHQDDAFQLLRQQYNLADVSQVQTCLKNTAQHEKIAQTVAAAPEKILGFMRKYFSDGAWFLKKNPNGVKELLLKYRDETIAIMEKYPADALAYVRDFCLEDFIVYIAAQPVATKTFLKENVAGFTKYIERHAKAVTGVALAQQPAATMQFLRAHADSTIAFLVANPWTTVDFFNSRADQIMAIMANHPAETMMFLAKHSGATLAFLAKEGPRVDAVELLLNKHRKGAIAFLYNNPNDAFAFLKRHPEESIAAFGGDSTMLDSKNRKATMKLALASEDAVMGLLKKFPHEAIKLLQKSAKQAMGMLERRHSDVIEVMQRHPAEVIALLKADRKGAVAMMVRHREELMELLGRDTAATVALLVSKAQSAVKLILTKHQADTTKFLLHHFQDTMEFMATNPKDTMRLFLDSPSATMATLKRLEVLDFDPSFESGGPETVTLTLTLT